MCEYCNNNNEKTLLKKEFLQTNFIGWDKDMLATELFGTEYYESIFIDRGYLRMADENDCDCIDHGIKVKINYCPMCGRELKGE